MNKMQGTLKKWTNYWNGWQPRWFVLDKGILSYYESELTVDQGCKGSINVSASEISSHPSDAYRLDVVVPGEQHFHLKAGSPQERQQWLVALGSLKTCLNSEQASHLLLEEDEMKRKFCELRLYCDLLVQQVHSIKSDVINNPIPDVQKLDENSMLLGDTCDQFIRTVEDCMRLSSPPSPIGYKCTLPDKKPSHHKEKSHILHTSGSSKKSNERVKNDFVVKTKYSDKKSLTEDSDEDVSKSKSNGHKDFKAAVPLTTAVAPSKTFFSQMPISFATIRLNDDGSVPTFNFLESCTGLSKIFDLMGSTAFAPVKMDLNGNIRKVMQSYETDKERFVTLNAIVESEIERQATELPNSATDALLWLRRGINFLRQFLQCFLDGEQDMSKCANIAYGKTLKKHHGWVVRGVFSLAANAAPTREDFVKSLYSGAEDDEIDSEALEKELVPYLAGIDRCLKSLDRLYRTNNLVSDDQD